VRAGGGGADGGGAEAEGVEAGGNCAGAGRSAGEADVSAGVVVGGCGTFAPSSLASEFQWSCLLGEFIEHRLPIEGLRLLMAAETLECRHLNIAGT
jgi:hypothetical protein